MVPDLSPRARLIALSVIAILAFVGLPALIMSGSDASWMTKFTILAMASGICALVIGAALAQIRGRWD